MSHVPSLRNPIACLMRYISSAKKALQTHTSGSMTDAIHRRNVTQSLWVSRKWSEPQRSARVMNNTHTSIPKKLEKLNQNELWTGLHFWRLRSGSSLEHKQLAFGFGSFFVPTAFPINFHIYHVTKNICSPPEQEAGCPARDAEQGAYLELKTAADRASSARTWQWLSPSNGQSNNWFHQVACTTPWLEASQKYEIRPNTNAGILERCPVTSASVPPAPLAQSPPDRHKRKIVSESSGFRYRCPDQKRNAALQNIKAGKPPKKLPTQAKPCPSKQCLKTRSNLIHAHK